MQQRTLLGPTEWVVGREFQSGRATRIKILPAEQNFGIKYALGTERKGEMALGSVPISARLEHATNRDRCICLEQAGTIITNVEHLNAVLVALGIDNALVILDKKGLWRRVFQRQAVPMPADSTESLVAAIDAAGVLEQEWDRRAWSVSEPFELRDPQKGDFVRVDPADGLWISCTSGYERIGIDEATLEVEITPNLYRSEIAGARTLMNQATFLPFGLVKAGATFAYPRYGLGSGIDTKGMLIMKNGNPMGAARYGGPAQELVRHKIIDFLGALALVAPVENCRFTVYKSSHRHDLEFFRALQLQQIAAAEVAV